ncbi:alpha/beta-hydrolase [Gonapodya prolifera JEL478]|uniref:Alpha/beta-hydrolase n=1 Tax=Gonapodya prolifera (strain JEL478) TaxID=1344416 RepID=A0A139ACM0_GONPJ|nr:alpha/beta-hydrolase [Gonapodya prolifera JEL478]|eukprot:KXS14561.1 alpha/beta-hydrolase [Gonapodya prolifera JEL478]
MTLQLISCDRQQPNRHSSQFSPTMTIEDPKDKLLVAESCCGAAYAKPVLVPPNFFKPRGKDDTLGELPIYVVEPEGGPKSTKEALIVIYDIVGTGHPNNKQACDYLANHTGLLTVQPDVFRRRVPVAEFMADPPEPGTPDAEIASLGLTRRVWDRIVEFTQKGAGSYQKVVKNDLVNTIAFLKKTHGVEKVGIVGFCYGGEIIIKAAQDDDLIGDVKVVVGIHPAFITIRDGENVKIPVALLPGNNDPDFTEVIKAMQDNPKCKTVLHHRYEEVPHGFCTARGDFTDETVKRNALDCFHRTAQFLEENF